jgi:hypothetical protein
MDTQRQTLLTRARIVTAGLVIAAGSATGLLTVAAAHAGMGGVATSTTGDSSGTSTGRGSNGQSTGSSSSSGSGGSVASSHSS